MGLKNFYNNFRNHVSYSLRYIFDPEFVEEIKIEKLAIKQMELERELKEAEFKGKPLLPLHASFDDVLRYFDQ